MSFSALDARCIAMLQTLLLHEDYVSILELAKKLNVSRRSIYYDLNKINEWCEEHDIPMIFVERSKGLYLTKVQREKIHPLIVLSDVTYTVYQPQERVAIIICQLMAQSYPSFIDSLSNLCDVSRNTVFNDLKSVRKKLEKYGLSLVFETHVGYSIEGSIMRKRAVFLYYLEILLPFIKQKVFDHQKVVEFYHRKKVDELYRRLKRIEEKLKTSYVQGVLTSLATLLYVIMRKEDVIDLEDVDIHEISRSSEFSIVQAEFTELSLHEQIYLAMHFLGSRVQVAAKTSVNGEILEMANELVDRFEKLACINFESRDQLISMLAHHLNMSIYRYQYGIQLGNPLMEDIRKSYADLYDITAKAVMSLKKNLGYPIAPSEIAYITMHFGGFLKRRNASNFARVLIVCPNGISTANMLASEVESLHPSIEVVDIVGAEEIASYYGKIDFIISTVDVNAFVPVIRVNPIISEEDRIRILSRVVSESTKQKPAQITMEKVLKIVGPYLGDEQFEKVQMELSSLFNQLPSNVNTEYSIRLFDVLTQEYIQVKKRVSTWQEALEIASKPLLESHRISTNYIGKMIENVVEYGPYIVIAPYLALGHALPTDGVMSLGVSLLKLEEDVFFDDRPVSVVMILAPIDKRSHLGIMKDILRLFNDALFVSSLADCQSEAQVSELFSQYSKKEEDVEDEISRF